MLTNKKKRLQYLRERWGKSVDQYRNYDLISSYHDLIKSKPGEFVDDKTWQDLEMDSVFSKIDRNISGVGQQYLYHTLRKYENSSKALSAKYKLVSTLKQDQELRESLQLKLFNLTGDSAYFIAYLIHSDSIPHTKWYPLFYILSILSVISAALISLNGAFLFITIAILLTNLIINKVYSRKIYEYFTGFSSLNALINSAIAMSKISSEQELKEIQFLKQNRGLLKSLKKKLGYLVIDKQSMNELAVIAIEYLNMFLLFDLIAYYRSVNVLLKNQYEIGRVFETIGSLDASISIASYLFENPQHCIPQFNNTGTINFNSLYHPLIDNAVSNSLDDLSNSALITGSNMSGKTTFIKTLGINFILAQTINICLANEVSFPMLMVKSSIRRNEDLESGKSYFFVEIELLKEFIELSESGNQYLFLIDEIFRGTNTLERLATSTSVLSYLNNKNKVFCTTHDIELQDLLKDSFRMFHFSEQVDKDKFYFNYKIQSGPCSSGNAIKLLGIMDYPDTIVNESNKLVQTLIRNGNELNV